MNLNKMRKDMMDYAVSLQTENLIAFAQKEIKKLGDKIQTYNSANHMDRTGNLLNSLCWGVTYNGEMKGSGFYRDAVTHGRGINGASVSFLHEFFSNDQEEVNGRQRAEDFIASFQGKSGKWTVFFAILAPYWGYWESGFTMKSHFGDGKRRFMQFQVMTHIYDEVRMGLKPAKTRLSVYVPKYSYKNPKYKNKRGYVKIGVER